MVGALNDGFERCSVKYAGKVFHESFLRSAEAGRLGIPAAPLSEFFTPVAQLAERLGVAVRLKAGVDHIAQTADKRWQVDANGEQYVAILVGMGGAWDKWFIDSTPELKKVQPGSTLYVFAL